MATAGWSSLPSDLVNRFADCLLADNDLDYYMDLRAVCSDWRAATADPRGPDAPRFRPLNWVLLDEASGTGSRLFVNVVTGYFLRRDLPVLDKYDLVTTTAGGLIVLAERRGSAAPRAARVLNPFTGSMIRYVAPIPPELKAASGVLGSMASSSTLLLFCKSSHTIYYTDTAEERFAAYPETFSLCPLFAVAIRSGVCAASKGVSTATPSALLDLVSALPAMKDVTNRCFMVESASAMEILIVVVRRESVGQVMKMDPVRIVLEPVTGLGCRALFLGVRCLSVDAERFPSIRANCVYYEDCRNGRRSGIYQHDMADGKEERVDDALFPFMNPLTDDDLWPYTVIQLLSSYAVNVPQPQLDRQDFPFRVRYSIK